MAKNDVSPVLKILASLHHFLHKYDSREYYNNFHRFYHIMARSYVAL